MPDLHQAGDRNSRVLVFAPVGRDAELTREFLDRTALANEICTSIAELCRALETEGAGVLLLTEETLDEGEFGRLVTLLDRQPSWSDIPVLLFAGGSGADMTLRTIRSIETLRNVTLLERPIRLAAVLSAIRAALRSRARQYDVRDLLTDLQEARAAAESANRLKDEFLATLSHELRTPLNAILGWTSMLTHGQVPVSRMPHVFDALDRNAQAQAQLINDVLDVSRIVTGKLHLNLATVDMCDLVERATDAVRPAASAKDIQMTVHFASECFVRGDADRLQQVVWNLLMNAVKFTAAKGAIDISVECDEGHVDVSVTDTGVGIAPEFLPYVFERFRQADQTTTRAHGGLGLGLAIVRHLTELHGGSVSASSPGVGHGATFHVRLPVHRAGVAPGKLPPAPAARNDRSFLNRTILVIDDDAPTREMLTAAFGQTGARVRVVASAAEGWDALRQELPDILVADLAMPGEDGFSFIRRVRESCASQDRLPAIAFSALADARSETEARRAGFSAFVAKPARPETLLHVASALMSAPDGSAGQDPGPVTPNG